MSSQVQKLLPGHVAWPQGQGHNSHNTHFTAALKKCGFCSGSELQKWVFLLGSSPATLTLLCHKTLVQYPLIQSQLNSKLTHWVTNILRGSATVCEIEILSSKSFQRPSPSPPPKKQRLKIISTRHIFMEHPVCRARNRHFHVLFFCLILILPNKQVFFCFSDYLVKAKVNRSTAQGQRQKIIYTSLSSIQYSIHTFLRASLVVQMIKNLLAFLYLGVL